MLKRDEIRIRDPFIVTDKQNGCYYMYGTTALVEGSLRAGNTFSVYKTYDLENFEEPKVVFDGAAQGFWGTRDFWAPEVHFYNGKYYLFGSCKSDDRCRATHIFVCDTPDGTFVPVSDEPPTPADWECLDGTLFVDNGVPYMVFCHEWVQVGDGEMCAIQLSEDLTHSVGEPILLFRASENPDVGTHRGVEGHYVTDGPYFYRENGKIIMIWSSHGLGRYLVLEAESDSLRGPWKQKGSKYDMDGGHAMLFENLEGKRMISLHSPNKAGQERAKFMEY